MPDAQTLNALFSGAVLVLGAMTALITTRGKRATVRRRDYRGMEQRLLIAFGHIFVLETALAGRGVTPPARPAGLDPRDDDEDAPPVAALPPAPTPTGPPRV